ncbi:hypothetical protein GCK72_010854 [Caenorhabditis remanei]|uniref:Skp1-related protein n=1 Tax=Caenorhabditis remanei TaxID=31234 RepID=A0A6A5H8C9_CAERE|nr:hypothetical protein GCK72_010854 [Caenorhabditis remanei]KAF1762592.1 hypothetical protein GCK72_010854 [Caenorhabditis remanei]
MSAEQAPVEVPAADAPVAEAEPAPVAEEAPAAETAPAEPLFYYTLESCDGKEVKISSEAVKQSKTLNDLVWNLHGGAEMDESIPMDNITHPTLIKVVEFCEHHKGEPIPVDDGSVPKKVTITEWDEEFFKMDDMELFHLVLAANYLDIKQLLNYACKKVAQMAMGKSPEELRAIFMIPTDEEIEAAEKAAEKEEVARQVAYNLAEINRKIKEMEQADAAASRAKEAAAAGAEELIAGVKEAS